MLRHTGIFFVGSIAVASATSLSLGPSFRDTDRESPSHSPTVKSMTLPRTSPIRVPNPLKTNVVMPGQERDSERPGSITFADMPEESSGRLLNISGSSAGKQPPSALNAERPGKNAALDAVGKGKEPAEPASSKDGKAAASDPDRETRFVSLLATRELARHALDNSGTAAASTGVSSSRESGVAESGTQQSSIADLVGTLPDSVATLEVIKNGEALLNQISSYGDAAVAELEGQLRFASAPATREWAARALAQIGTVDAVRVLVNSILQEDDAQMRRSLSRYFAALDKTDSMPVLVYTLSHIEDEGLLSDVRRAFTRLATADAVRALELEYAQKRQSDAQRGRLLKVFAQIYSPNAIPALAEILLGSSDPQLGERAAQALGLIGEENAVAVLASCIEARGVTDPADSWVRCIEQVHNKEAFACLIQLFEDPSISEALRHGVAVALANAGEEGRQYGIEMLRARAEASVPTEGENQS